MKNLILNELDPIFESRYARNSTKSQQSSNAVIDNYILHILTLMQQLSLYTINYSLFICHFQKNIPGGMDVESFLHWGSFGRVN